MMEPKPFTDAEVEGLTGSVALLTAALATDIPVSLERATLDDIPIGVVCVGREIDQHLVPLFILVTDDLMERIVPPEDCELMVRETDNDEPEDEGGGQST